MSWAFSKLFLESPNIFFLSVDQKLGIFITLCRTCRVVRNAIRINALIQLWHFCFFCFLILLVFYFILERSSDDRVQKKMIYEFIFLFFFETDYAKSSNSKVKIKLNLFFGSQALVTSKKKNGKCYLINLENGIHKPCRKYFQHCTLAVRVCF